MIRLRPSTLSRVARCHGSAMMCEAVEAAVGELPAAPQAAMGQDLHAVVGMTLLYATRHDADVDRPREAIEPLESSIRYAEGIVAMRYSELNGYDRWCIAQCILFAYRMIDEAVIEPRNVLVEQHLDGDHIGLERGGTADLVLLAPFRRAIVIDWKLGYLDQDDAADHDQLSAYAMMVANKYRLDDAHVWIYQPRQDRDRRQSGARYDAEALRSRYDWAIGVCRAANHPDARLSPGYPQCQYCDALIFCEPARKYIMRARDALALMGPPKDPQLLSEMAGARVIAQRFADEAKAYLRLAAKDGVDIPGYALRSTGQIRSIDDVIAAHDVAGSIAAMDKFLAACKVSVKALAESLGPDAMDEHFGHLVVVADKQPALMPRKAK